MNVAITLRRDEPSRLTHRKSNRQHLPKRRNHSVFEQCTDRCCAMVGSCGLITAERDGYVGRNFT